MVKKVTPPAEKQLAQTVKESAQQIWLAGLGAFSKTQEEGTKVFDALVKEGEAIQKCPACHCAAKSKGPFHTR